MVYFSLSDITEEQRELFQLADRLGLWVLIFMAVGITASIVYAVVIARKNPLPKQYRRDVGNYVEANGIITRVTDVTYSVNPHQRKELRMEDLDEGGLFRKKTSERERLERDKYEKDYSLKSDEKAEPIEKLRYDVEYEFTCSSDGNIYRGEFSVYSKSESIAEGKSVTVMYNPAKPTANYTKYNSPIGRY